MNKPNPGLFIFFLLKVLDGFHFFLFYFIFFTIASCENNIFPPCESDSVGKAPGNQTAGLKRGIILYTTTEMNL